MYKESLLIAEFKEGFSLRRDSETISIKIHDTTICQTLTDKLREPHFHLHHKLTLICEQMSGNEDLPIIEVFVQDKGNSDINGNKRIGSMALYGLGHIKEPGAGESRIVEIAPELIRQVLQFSCDSGNFTLKFVFKGGLQPGAHLFIGRIGLYLNELR